MSARGESTAGNFEPALRSGGVFCGSGGCSFGFGGNALWQGEANLGLIIAF